MDERGRSVAVLGHSNVQTATRIGESGDSLLENVAAPGTGALRQFRMPQGQLASLPIAASRPGLLGGTVATVGFPDIGLHGFAPKVDGI